MLVVLTDSTHVGIKQTLKKKKLILVFQRKESEQSSDDSLTHHFKVNLSCSTFLLTEIQPYKLN